MGDIHCWQVIIDSALVSRWWDWIESQ